MTCGSSLAPTGVACLSAERETSRAEGLLSRLQAEGKLHTRHIPGSTTRDSPNHYY
jgi:hypothetical protein